MFAEEERPLKDSPGGWEAFNQHLKVVVLLKMLGQNTAVKVMFRRDLAGVVSGFQGMYNPFISTFLAMHLSYGWFLQSHVILLMFDCTFFMTLQNVSLSVS